MPIYNVTSTIKTQVFANSHEHAHGIARNLILERAGTIEERNWLIQSELEIDALSMDIPEHELRKALSLAIQGLRQRECTDTLDLIELLRPAPQRVED